MDLLCRILYKSESRKMVSSVFVHSDGVGSEGAVGSGYIYILYREDMHLYSLCSTVTDSSNGSLH